jgi:hypothetical protein
MTTTPTHDIHALSLVIQEKYVPALCYHALMTALKDNSGPRTPMPRWINVPMMIDSLMTPMFKREFKTFSIDFLDPECPEDFDMDFDFSSILFSINPMVSCDCSHKCDNGHNLRMLGMFDDPSKVILKAHIELLELRGAPSA